MCACTRRACWARSPWLATWGGGVRRAQGPAARALAGGQCWPGGGWLQAHAALRRAAPIGGTDRGRMLLGVCLPPTPLSTASCHRRIPAGDRAAVDAQRALHLSIAQATRCLKNGVLVENDEGSVARYLAAHPEVAAQIGAGAAAAQQQRQQAAG